MNTTFNINRLGLLFKRFFVENRQREITFWSIAIFVFMLVRDNSAVEMFLMISGLVVAANMFKIFAYTPGGMHYLLIPATHTEKLVSSILLSTIYFFSMFIVTYIIGTWLGNQLGNFLFSSEKPLVFSLFEMNNISDNWQGRAVPHLGILNTFLRFTSTQSIFLLGSLFFKRNAIGRTFLSLIAISLVFIFIQIVLIKINYGSWETNINLNNTILLPTGMKLFQDYEWILKLLTYLFIPFLWLVSYFRLTEKEV